MGASLLTHIILATVGTDGDVFPYVGLGRVLRGRGHRVTLATSGEQGRMLADPDLVQQNLSVPMASPLLQPALVSSCSARPEMTGALTIAAWIPHPLGRAYWLGGDAPGLGAGLLDAVEYQVGVAKERLRRRTTSARPSRAAGQGPITWRRGRRGSPRRSWYIPRKASAPRTNWLPETRFGPSIANPASGD